MRQSLFLKLFFGILLIIVLLTGLILLSTQRNIRSHYLDTLAQNLRKMGEILKPRVMNFLEEDQTEELDAWIKDQAPNIDARITVVDSNGIVLADSDEDPKIMVNHRYRPEIAEAFEGSLGRSLRFSNTVKADMLYVGLPLRLNGTISHVLRVSLYVQDIDRLLASLARMIWMIGLGLTLVALLGSFILTRFLMRPLNEIDHASRLVASGDFSARLSIVRRDEFGKLGRSFNYMTERIQALFDELSRQKEELVSIISSIDEGIIVLDKEGRILFSNSAFHRIVENEAVLRKFYWEVVRKQQFTDLIKQVKQEQRNKSAETAFGSRIFLCNAVYIANRDEVVVSFYDITRTKMIEAVKKDFVENVSHELNTPLAAIKGYVETLAEEIGPEHHKYLEIVRRHTERLINIVKDLLTLSELESEKTELKVEKLNLIDVVKDILKIFKEPIKAKNLRLECEFGNESLIIEGDRFKLEQLFINLIDNAVKYTEKGKIIIRIQKTDTEISVQVQDAGIGIPEEHLPRIFERFYVIDKSRSRQVGGTGLGLSIAKHIAGIHQARIEVQSRPGEGSTFTVLFPAQSN